MAEPDALADRISSISEGRASVPRLKDGVLTLALDVTGLEPADRDALNMKVREAALAEPGVMDVRIALTAEKKSLRILAVGSGKGGVGKSTLSANLAVALQALGHRVGLVDADIYGPSQPRLMGSEGVKPRAEEKQLIPVISPTGMPMLSMGHLVEPGRAIAWRGPMAAGALAQLVEAKWGTVDLLVVDLPPGTGDVQLSMIQKFKPAGAVIVSTPQDLALIDATRAVNLFAQANVPLVGLVENMAGYICPHCGELSDPFGRGGAEAAAGDMDLPFLGRIPLDIAIRTASDAGCPPALDAGLQGDAFRAIAAKVSAWLKGGRDIISPS